METVVSPEAAALWPYAVGHLAETCRVVSDLADRIQEYEIHPGRNDDMVPGKNVQQEIERLTPLLDEQILYLGRVLDGLRSVLTKKE